MGAETISPSTVGNIGMGAQVLGMITQTAGSYKKSSGEQQGYEYQSKIARNNADITEQQAHDAMLRGQQTENNVRTRTANLKGSQRASLAARGIDLGVGSALNILTDTDFMGERDALIARDNANKEVWGLRTQAQNYQSNADMLAWRSGQQDPVMDAAGTFLTGAGRVASSWYSMRNAKTGYSGAGSGIE